MSFNPGEVKAIHVAKAVVNPRFAGQFTNNNGNDGKTFSMIQPGHTVAVFKQLTSFASHTDLMARRAKDAESTKGQINVRNADDVKVLVNVLIDTLQWNCTPNLFGVKPIHRLMHEWHKRVSRDYHSPTSFDGSLFHRPAKSLQEFIDEKNVANGHPPPPPPQPLDGPAANTRTGANAAAAAVQQAAANPAQAQAPPPLITVDNISDALRNEFLNTVPLVNPIISSSQAMSGLLSDGVHSTRPIGADADWETMCNGTGFFRTNTDREETITKAEEQRFLNAGKQLMLAISGTNIKNDYTVNHSAHRENFLFHYVEKMVITNYTSTQGWQAMIQSVLSSVSEIKDLKDRHTVLTEYLPYLAKVNNGTTPNYIQMIEYIKLAYKEMGGINPVEHWHNYNALIREVDNVKLNVSRQDELPDLIKRILEEVGKMTINHSRERKGLKRQRDNSTKAVTDKAQVKKAGIIVTSVSGLNNNNSGNGQGKKNTKVPHCWCCCADQSYTLENGHHAKHCPKYSTVPVKDNTKSDWIATSKSDPSKTMSRNEQKSVIDSFMKKHGLMDKPIPKKNNQ